MGQDVSTESTMNQYRSSGASDDTSYPIGVIIPTYNRADALMLCLEHLEAQNWKDFEVVVVDDGSTDDTALQMENYTKRSALAVHYLRQTNSGPARARNVAIAHLHSAITVMIGDDILVTPDFVETHLSLHQRRPEARIAGLGLTRWCEAGQRVTPFMRWLDQDGLQFAYKDLLHGVPPDWRHFYTSNLSLKTAHLRAHPFHEAFRGAAMEDIELGYRLTKQDALEMEFLADAVADHLHPTTVQRACRRMISVGAAAYLFEHFWPEQKQLPVAKARRIARSFFLNDTWALPLLRIAASVLTRFKCPNFLLKRVLFLHKTFGYTQEAVRHTASSGTANIPS